MGGGGHEVAAWAQEPAAEAATCGGATGMYLNRISNLCGFHVDAPQPRRRRLLLGAHPFREVWVGAGFKRAAITLFCKNVLLAAQHAASNRPFAYTSQGLLTWMRAYAGPYVVTPEHTSGRNTYTANPAESAWTIK